jgi:hypothetical protein
LIPTDDSKLEKYEMSWEYTKSCSLEGMKSKKIPLLNGEISLLKDLSY